MLHVFIWYCMNTVYTHCQKIELSLLFESFIHYFSLKRHSSLQIAYFIDIYCNECIKGLKKSFRGRPLESLLILSATDNRGKPAANESIYQCHRSAQPPAHYNIRQTSVRLCGSCREGVLSDDYLVLFRRSAMILNNTAGPHSTGWRKSSVTGQRTPGLAGKIFRRRVQNRCRFSNRLGHSACTGVPRTHRFYTFHRC